MPVIYCHNCQNEFSVKEDEQGYVQCPECETEFKLGESQEFELDTFEDRKPSFEPENYNSEEADGISDT